jgi:hypothetical protein
MLKNVRFGENDDSSNHDDDESATCPEDFGS